MVSAKNTFQLLEELRGIAQLGLCYAKDPFDRERYEHLLVLASAEYSKLSGIPDVDVLARFRSELGYVTPKVAVVAAVFSPEGCLLLIRRSDDHLWGLPAGWAELGETPAESVRREVLEETGLDVEVGAPIDVFGRLPGAFGQPHTSVHVLYHAVVKGGSPSCSSEASEIGFYDHRAMKAWHKDHQEMAQRACRFWLDAASKASPR